MALELTQMIIWELDDETRRVRWWGDEQPLFDRPLTYEVIASDDLGLVHADDRARVAACWRDHEKGGVARCEYRVNRPDGTLVWVSSSRETMVDSLGDPAGAIQEKRREKTIRELLDFYEEHGCFIQRGLHKGKPMKPLTKKYTMGRLRNHVEPLLGHRRASEITAGDIEKFVIDVKAGKTAKDEKIGPRKRIIVRGGEGAARKVVRDLSAVFSFAGRHGFVQKNPVEKASVRKTDNRRERFLTLEEVGRLGAAFEKVEADGANPKAVAIARLWALTGCRRNEIAAIKVHEVNLERNLFEFDDTKTGKSIRPFGPAAAALLKVLLDGRKTGYLFPAEKGDGYYQSTRKIWTKVIERAQLPGVTPHTLRHTLGSTATSSGEALALTGAILGHANLRSTAIYAHVQHDPSLEAARRVETLLASALSGKGAEQQEEDVPADGLPALDADLIRALAQRLSKEGADAARLRSILTQVMEITHEPPTRTLASRSAATNLNGDRSKRVPAPTDTSPPEPKRQGSAVSHCVLRRRVRRERAALRCV